MYGITIKNGKFQIRKSGTILLVTVELIRSGDKRFDVCEGNSFVGEVEYTGSPVRETDMRKRGAVYHRWGGWQATTVQGRSMQGFSSRVSAASWLVNPW